MGHLFTAPFGAPLRSIFVLAAGGMCVGCSTSAPASLEGPERLIYGSRSTVREPLADAPVRERATIEASNAAVQVDPPADLAGYLELGLERSSKLRAAFERWSGHVEQETVAVGLPNPRVSWAEFVEELETRAGPVRRRIGLMQGLPFPGVRAARGELAEARSGVAWAELERVRLELFGEIERAFSVYAYLSAKLDLVERQLALLQELEPIVQGRIQGGSPQSDLLQLQVEIGRLMNDQASGEGALIAASAELEAAVEWSGARPLPRVLAVGERDLGRLDRAELRRIALANAPELREAGARAELASAEVALADVGRWPGLELGLEWFDTGPSLSPGSPDSGDDALALRLSFGLPVWGGRDAARVRSARHGARAAEYALEAVSVGLGAELELLAFQLEDAARQIVLYRDELLPRARAARDLRIADYRGGAATLLDVIDAERVELELLDGYARAVRDSSIARTRLETLIGAEL